MVRCRILTLILSLVIFSSQVIQTHSDNQPTNQDIRNVVIILFDPTILNQGENEKLDIILDEFKNFYSLIPENTLVCSWIIKRKMFNESPTYRKEFFKDISYHGHKKHIDSLNKSSDFLIGIFKKFWEYSHTDSEINKPTSCLITSFYTAGKYLKHRYLSDKYRCYLLLISDMLEACNEWEKTINFEKNLEEFHNLNPPIDLSTLVKVIFIKVSNSLINTPLKDYQLENIWRNLLHNQLKVKKESFICMSDFPSYSIFNQ